MVSLRAFGREVKTIFELLGDKENDITKSIAWVLYKCPELLNSIVKELLLIDIDFSDVDIEYQEHDSKEGFTDLEIKDNKSFHIIIEAKLGWNLPGETQLTKYSMRKTFADSPVNHKLIVSMSDAPREYAERNLPKVVNGITVKHLPWKRIGELAEESSNSKKSNNKQKNLLRELKKYIGGISKMERKESNWVYVVSLKNGYPENCELSWIDIVEKLGKYFHPAGKNWPKEPPNYIAFRYDRKLQHIHHIDDYIVTKNIHDEITEMPDYEREENFFVYSLGPAIIPNKEVRTGKVYPSGRVWAMLDTLLTSDTISEAIAVSKER